MGKQLKKGRPPPGGNRLSKKVTKQSAETAEVEQRSCVHFDKRVDLNKLLKKMKACEKIKCRECKEGVDTRRGSEGKLSSFSFDASKKAIWLCLECGRYSCGSVSLPTEEAQSHVMSHFRLTSHRLVIQCENTRLRWCFACNSLLPFEKEVKGVRKDLLLETVKLIKERSSHTYSSETVAEDSCSSGISSEIKGSGYAVRGLVNLGNTCFFNSVVQNLLSLDQLRDRVLKDDMCCVGGPLVSSLKKLFTEATSEAGLFNPVDFFGSLCCKAPQFRGYQQHDSHELLRCLLDGLSTEELEVCGDSEKPTLVDSVFGGEVSSTISCLECGHSSKVYEPFLDLSLPVPSKKQTLSQEERSKLTPPTKVLENVKDSSEAVSTMTFDPEIIVTQNDMEEVDSFWWEAFGIEVSHNENDLVSQGHVSDNDDGSDKEAIMQCSKDQTVDYVDFSCFFEEPDVSCDDKTLKEREGEVSKSLMSSHLNEPDVSCNDKTVRECEGEVSSSYVSGDHEQKIDNADYYWFFDEPEISKGPVFGPPTKPEASKAGFSSNSDAEVLDDSGSPVSVDTCLAMFTKPEILSEDNAWHCENCSNNLKLQRLREKRELFGNGWMNDNIFNQCFTDDEAVDSEEVIVRSAATKRVLINKAPPVLTIHLKRFSQNARGRLSKLRGRVAFNEFIDLGLYMDKDSRWTEEDQPVYMLAGLVEHTGTMRRGHYVAYIRGDHNGKRDSSIWYRASDSFVRQVSFEEVLRSEAYILFYQRI